MKIVYQNVLWLVFFVAYNYTSLADDPEGGESIIVDIVGFFEEKNSQENVAVRTAVSNFNTMRDKVEYNVTSFVVGEVDDFRYKNFLCELAESGNLGGIISPVSPKLSPMIESIASNLEIPALQVNWRPTPLDLKDSMVVNFYPHTRLLFQGLGMVVKHLQWRSIVIFYENAENLLLLQDILKVQSYDGNLRYNSIIVKELGPGPDYRPVLKQIQNISEHRIIVDCRTPNIYPILKQAQELKLLERQFSYFLTSLDAHTVDLTPLNTQANITTVRILDPLSGNFQNALSRWRLFIEENGINIDVDTWSIKTETALMYDAVLLYINSLKDLHVSGTKIIQPRSLKCDERNEKWEAGFSVASFLRRHTCENLVCATGPISFDNFGRRIGFNLHVIDGNREEAVAVWDPEEPEKLKFHKSEEDRSKELERKWSQGTLTVASILVEPHLMKKQVKKDEDAPTGNARYEGFSMDLITALAHELDDVSFRFEVLDNQDRGAYKEETKSWNGLVREILDRKADLAICDFTITPERREVVDFSTPFMQLGISILYKKPETKDADKWAFLDPLSLDLWMYSATLYLIITVFIYFISRLSPSDWENPHPCNQEPEELENIWEMKNSLWLTLGSILNQGCDILPKGLAFRMATAMWWFYAIIVTNSYMANLAAFLTNERSQGQINSAEDLAKQTKVKYGTMLDGSTMSFFKNSNFSTYQRMWTAMEQSKPTVFEKSNTAGVARVRNSKDRGYAFLMESASLEYEIQTKCDLMQVGNLLDSKSYGIAMPLDYPHRSRINEALLKLLENGKINELKEKWWKKKRKEPPCPETPDEGPSNKLALQNVGGVFIVLGAGIALSYAVGICEFLWNVRNLSIEEHIPFSQALKVELLFAFNIMITKKRVKPQISESSSSDTDHRSIAHSILRGAGSFLGLDVVSKAGTPTSRHSSRPLD